MHIFSHTKSRRGAGIVAYGLLVGLVAVSVLVVVQDSGDRLRSMLTGTANAVSSAGDPVGSKHVTEGGETEKVVKILGRPECVDGDLSPFRDIGCGRNFPSGPPGFYAGDHPVTGEDFFVARCDLEASFADGLCQIDEGQDGRVSWKFRDNKSAVDAVPNGAKFSKRETYDGEYLTNQLMGDEIRHYAAAGCRDLGEAWYLPAVAELDSVYIGLVEGHYANSDNDTNNPIYRTGNGSGGVDTLEGVMKDSFTTWSYWSSTEWDPVNDYQIGKAAHFFRFSDGRNSISNKEIDKGVRCMRLQW